MDFIRKIITSTNLENGRLIDIIRRVTGNFNIEINNVQ